MEQDLQSTLPARGPALARRLDSRRQPIVTVVAEQLASAFPDLPQTVTLADPSTRRIASVHVTTLRLHQLIQLVLRTGTLPMIAREYAWLWGLVRREGVTGEHLRAQARWYITAARIAGTSDPADQALLDAIGRAIDAAITQLEGVAAL